MTIRPPAERIAVQARDTAGAAAAAWRRDHRDDRDTAERDAMWRSFTTGKRWGKRGAELIGVRLGLADALAAVPFTGDPCTVKIDVHETCDMPYPCPLHP